MAKIPKQTLRGLIAQVARRDNKPLSNVSLFDLRAMIVAAGYGPAAGYDPVAGADINEILTELRKGPYPTIGEGRVGKFSFEFWFNYFFAELSDRALDTASASKKMEYALYVINDDGSFRSRGQVIAAAAANGLSLARLFRQMLDLGFTPFQDHDHLSAEEVQLHAAEKNLLQSQVNVLFRGDARGWKTIKVKGGTIPQTRVEEKRAELGLDEPWHPFFDNGTTVWVRNGDVNMDNCLFSAVSVTPQFYVATKFPLLGDLEGTNPEAVGHAILLVRDRPQVGPALNAFQMAQAAIDRHVGPATERTITLTASQTNIYAVRIRGAYNTQNYQGNDAFPEYASDDLTWADHLVWFSVTRIHFHQFDGNFGHLIVINDHKVLHKDGVAAAALLGPHSWRALKAFVDDVVERGTLRGGVGGIIYTPPGVQPPPYDIVRIREPFIAGQPQKTQAQSAWKKDGGLVIPDAFRR